MSAFVRRLSFLSGLGIAGVSSCFSRISKYLYLFVTVSHTASQPSHVVSHVVSRLSLQTIGTGQHQAVIVKHRGSSQCARRSRGPTRLSLLVGTQAGRLRVAQPAHLLAERMLRSFSGVLGEACTSLRVAFPSTPPGGRLLDRVRALITPDELTASATPLPAITSDRTACELAHVKELDSRVSRLLLSPLAMGLQDLDERLLHQWCALNRRFFFPRTPFLFAYEWHVGVYADKKAQAESTCEFQGDLLLWDGAKSFLAVELKCVKPAREKADKEREKERLRHVAEQAAVARDLILPYILSRRRAGSNATFASARFLQSHDAFRTSRALGNAPMPLLAFPKAVLSHLDSMDQPVVRSCFVTNRPAEHGTMPGGFVLEQAEQAAQGEAAAAAGGGGETPLLSPQMEQRRRLAQKSLDTFSSQARVVAPMRPDSRLGLAARAAAAHVASTDVASTNTSATALPRPRAAGAAADASSAPQPDAAAQPQETGAQQQTDATPPKQTDAAAPRPSANEVRRRAVLALRATNDFTLTLSELALKVLPESVSFKQLGIRQGQPAQPSSSSPGSAAPAAGGAKRLFKLKDFLQSEAPFELVEKEGRVVLRPEFRAASTGPEGDS